MNLGTFLACLAIAFFAGELLDLVLDLAGHLRTRAARSRPPVVLFGTDRSDEP